MHLQSLDKWKNGLSFCELFWVDQAHCNCTALHSGYGVPLADVITPAFSSASVTRSSFVPASTSLKGYAVTEPPTVMKEENYEAMMEAEVEEAIEKEEEKVAQADAETITFKRNGKEMDLYFSLSFTLHKHTH